MPGSGFVKPVFVNDMPCNRSAFDRITVQDCGLRSALDRQGQLPGELIRILQADVHLLFTGGTVDVGGIASGKNTPA